MTADKHYMAIARLLAYMIAGDDFKSVDEILNWAYQVDDINQKPKPTKTKSLHTVSDEEVNSIYAIYPSKDTLNHDRILKAGSIDKRKIRSLIESGAETVDTLTRKVRQEVETRSQSQSFLRNLSTFLNNLPDLEDGVLSMTPPPPPAKSKYR